MTNPVLTIMHALYYLERNTPPEFRNQARIDAMKLLSDIYKQFEAEHTNQTKEN